MKPVGAATVLMAGLALAALMLSAAGRGKAPVRCSFGREHRLVNSREKLIDALAVVAGEKQASAFWSDAGGLFALPLTLQGESVAPPVRVGDRCRGGIDALGQPGGIYLGCLRHPNRDDASSPGGLAMYLLDDAFGVRRAADLGNTGALSNGVSLAATRWGLRVVWHDAASETARVWMADLDADLKLKSSRAISNPVNLAGAPSILVKGTRTWITWAETRLQGERLVGAVLLYDGLGAPRVLFEQEYRDALPQVADLGGRTLLAFRNRRDHSGVVGLYLARMEDDGRLSGGPMRAARADGETRPALSPCFGGLVIAAARTFGPEKFVGVNWVNRSLEKPAGEQQFFENSREFTLAASACAKDRALVLVAERGSSTQKCTNIRGVTYRCE